MDSALTPLIEALAERLVADYLTEKTAADSELDATRRNHAPLLPIDKAA